jgi:hypothetical protein
VPCFVTGIVPTSDVSELEKVLGDVPNIDHSKLTVITKSDQTEEHDESFLNFIHVGPSVEGDDFNSLANIDTALMTSSGGTGVPGITRSGSGLDFLNSEYVAAEIGVLPIPEDERANYNDALEEGRVVVAYECADADTAPIEAAMHQAGVRRVKTYRN